MSPNRWQQEKAIFLEALDREPEEREKFLEAACAEDPQLLERLEKLLQAHDAETFLENPVRLRFESRSDSPRDVTGLRLGAYRAREEIGRGGMGRVYRAERIDDHFRKTVAIKAIDANFSSESLVRRFYSERQILAGLEHPNIARLLDGGRTPEGIVFLVMEYVDGEPLDVFCDRRRLSIRQRLELCLQVCSAVQFAHQSLVIHRDLKPANILIDRSGSPRLLDFGIARILEETEGREPSPGGRPTPTERPHPPSEANPFETHTGKAPMTESPANRFLETATRVTGRFLTPAYASPEQVQGRTITTASDVYSLGVILYELLTGRSPYRSPGDGDRPSPDEWVRAVCDEPPEPPSRALRHPPPSAGWSPDTPSPEEASARRGTTPRRLERLLAGDLDSILLRAMHKRPEQRYDSVAALANDLRRHLEGFPVHARPASRAYRLQRFVGRNRAISAAILFLAVFSIAMAWLTQQVLRQKGRIEDQRTASEQVASFAMGLFELSDPGVSGGAELSTRELLEQGEQRLRREISAQPEVRARMLSTLGQLQLKTGNYQGAQSLLEEALTLRQGNSGAHSEEVAESQFHLAEALREMRDRKRAEPLYRAALRTRRALLGDRHPAVAEALGGLGQLIGFDERPGAGAPLFSEALEILQESAPESSEAAKMMYNLAAALQNLGDASRSLELFEESLELTRETLGPKHPQYADNLRGLGIYHFVVSELGPAEEYLSQALDLERQLYGESDHRVIRTLDILGRLCFVQGRIREAETIYEHAVTMARQHHQRLPILDDLLDTLASTWIQRGKLDLAEGLLDELQKRQEAGFESPYLEAGALESRRAWILLERGDADGAEALQRSVVQARQGELAPDHLRLLGAQQLLAEILKEQGRLEESEALYREVAGRMGESLAEGHLLFLGPWSSLARVANLSGKPREATEWIRRTRRLTTAQPHRTALFTAVLDSVEGESLRLLGDQAAAEPLLRRGYERLRALLGDESGVTVEARERLQRLQSP